MGPDKGFRARLFRALHAEALKRHIDHDGLRDIFGVKSLANVETEALQARLKAWSGHSVRRKTQLPRKGYGKSGELDMVGVEDLQTLANAFEIAGMDEIAQTNFIRRQLRGRAAVRTRADFHKVFSGVRAMNRRRAAK